MCVTLSGTIYPYAVHEPSEDMASEAELKKSQVNTKSQVQTSKYKSATKPQAKLDL